MRPAEEARFAAEEAPRDAAEEALLRLLPEEDRARVPADAALLRLLPDDALLRLAPDDALLRLLLDEALLRLAPDDALLRLLPDDLDPEAERLAVERVDPDEDPLRLLLPPLVVAILNAPFR